MPSSTTSSESARAQTRVLLVDDNQAILSRARAVLASACVVVGQAHDGETALSAAASLRPDVIVLDISMPGMSGFEVAAGLRKAGSTAAIVFLTVHDDADVHRSGAGRWRAGLCDQVTTRLRSPACRARGTRLPPLRLDDALSASRRALPALEFFCFAPFFQQPARQIRCRYPVLRRTSGIPEVRRWRQPSWRRRNLVTSTICCGIETLSCKWHPLCFVRDVTSRGAARYGDRRREGERRGGYLGPTMIARKGRKAIVAIALALAVTATTHAQGRTDVVTLANGDRITGEVERLERGRLEFKTDDAGTLYLEWDKLSSLVLTRPVEVLATDGRRFLGSLGPAAGSVDCRRDVRRRSVASDVGGDIDHSHRHELLGAARWVD